MSDTEIDERLSAYAARWRAAQPPPPPVPAGPVAVRRRRWLPLAAAAAVVLIAAGTGLAITVQTHRSGRGTAAAPPLCQIGNLRVLVADPGVRVTNMGDAACRFSGHYPVLLDARVFLYTAPKASGVLNPGDTYVQPYFAHGAPMPCPMVQGGSVTTRLVVKVEGRAVEVTIPSTVMHGFVCSTTWAGAPSIQRGQPPLCVASDFRATLQGQPVDRIRLTKVSSGTCQPGAGPADVLLTVASGSTSTALGTVKDSGLHVPSSLDRGDSVAVRLVDHSGPYCSGGLPTTWTDYAVVLPSNTVVDVPLSEPIAGHVGCVNTVDFDPSWGRSDA